MRLAVQGERNPAAKLSVEEVRTIRAALAGGWPKNSLAPLFGVSRRLLRLIETRRMWGHLED